MQLPTYKKRHVVKLKFCAEPGCNKEFWGNPIAKYCPLHNDPKFRKRRKRNVYVDVNNFVFDHHFAEVTSVVFNCALKGCSRQYTIKIFPKQFLYPKYCEQHRNAYKRECFLRMAK